MLTLFRQGLLLLPNLRKDPTLARGWLQVFHWIHLALPTLLLLLIFAVPPVSRSLVNQFYPRETFSKRLFSALSDGGRKENVRATRYQQFIALFWISGMGLFCFLLIADLPRVAALSPSTDTDTQDKNKVDNNEKTQARLSPLAEQTRFVGANRRYRIDKTIASGGAGTVYSAFDSVLERQVALKELYDTNDEMLDPVARFQMEAKALASLNHPNIIPIYDMFNESGHFWLVMELLSGGDLSDKIKNGAPLALADSLKITRDIASGLAYAHQQGLVHRDIKPGNVLFAKDGSLRITDFGIAKASTSNVKTQLGLILGSPGYMSPEQAAGEQVDGRSDIYSLGVTLYQMLTGQVPFEGDTTAVLLKHITQVPEKPSTINANIPAVIDALVMKMLAKKAHDRFLDCQQLVDTINRLPKKL